MHLFCHQAIIQSLLTRQTDTYKYQPGYNASINDPHVGRGNLSQPLP